MVNKKCVREGVSHHMIRGRLGTPIIGQRSVVIHKTREGTNATRFQRRGKSHLVKYTLNVFVKDLFEEGFKGQI